MSARWITAAALGALECLSAAVAQLPPQRAEPPAQSRPSASAAANPGAAARAFQPGVAIDWQAGRVRVDARVVLDEGPLEFFACFAGKEHESVLRMLADPEHVRMALGLAGMEPGAPAEWDEAAQRYRPPGGALIDVSIEWHAASGSRVAEPHEWLLEAEYAREPPARPWVFAGSYRNQAGRLGSAVTGAGVALVDDPSSLLALPARRSASNAELWAVADADEIPPVDTPVTLVFRSAKPRTHRVRLDAIGRLFVDERLCAIDDAVELVRISLELTPGRVQPIESGSALRADLERIRRALAAGGVPDGSLRFIAP